jgi:phosphoribosylglycinamide formyltransferase 2
MTVGHVPFRDRIGTPLVGNAPKLLLLGSGELGREVAIEAIRLGAEVIAADRYANAPAMAVAHRSHVLAMTDGPALRALLDREVPDLVIPEIEQIDTEELVRWEAEGHVVIPTASACRATMHRERIRRLASETAKVATSRFEFADSASEARTKANALGFPCVIKAMMSSSGHGMTVVRSEAEVEAAYQAAALDGRVPSPRVMLEQFVPFDLEVTVLTLRHYDRTGRPSITVLDPIGHARPGTVFHESWQPASVSPRVSMGLAATAKAVVELLGGFGIFGVECFVRGEEVLFSEVSPRPHDTGLVTLASQWNSEFALHARAVLGLPYVGPEPSQPAAAHVILAPSGGWAPSFAGLSGALSSSGVRIHLFGKPEGFKDRRMGVALARAPTTTEARELAAMAAHRVEAEIRFGAPRGRPGPPGA